MLTQIRQTPLGRRGILRTNHGEIQTPFFMPVGTAGAMRGISSGGCQPDPIPLPTSPLKGGGQLFLPLQGEG